MRLTRNDAEEVLHKMGVLSETPDLQEDYGLTQAQADELVASIPRNGGEWNPPAWAMEAVRGELDDAAVVLRHIAHNARSADEIGQALSADRLAARMERLAEGGAE